MTIKCKLLWKLSLKGLSAMPEVSIEIESCNVKFNEQNQEMNIYIYWR